MAEESSEGYLATISSLEHAKANDVQPSTNNMGMEVFKLLHEGRDLIVKKMFEPGDIEVICNGILERPWEKDNIRLIIVPNHFYVSRIATMMNALSQGYPIQVEICRTSQDVHLFTSIRATVAIATFSIYYMMNEIYPRINMVVFYLGNESFPTKSFYERYYDLTEMVRLCKRESVVQVAIFSERISSTKYIYSGSEIQEFEKMLRDPEVISSNSEIKTIEGIRNHQFIVVNDEVDRVDSIFKIIVDKKLSEDERNTIIYVEFLSVYDSLIKRLEDYGISTTKCCMSKEEIDSTVKEFLERTHVLITPRVWICDMIGFIANRVQAIINYSIVKTDEYFLRTYLLKEVHTAITLLSEAELKTELDILVDIQSTYDCVFKKLIMPRQLGESKACHFLASQVKMPPMLVKCTSEHYVSSVCKNIKKFDVMCEKDIFGVLKKALVSVIFVNNPGSMKRVSTSLNEKNKFDVECIKPGDCSTSIAKGRKPLVFVCGCGTQEFSEILNDCGITRKDVRLLINFDFPSSTREYRDRMECCDVDAIVVNFGIDVGLFGLLDMQPELSVRFVNNLYHVSYHLLHTYYDRDDDMWKDSDDDEPKPEKKKKKEKKKKMKNKKFRFF